MRDSKAQALLEIVDGVSGRSSTVNTTITGNDVATYFTAGFRRGSLRQPARFTSHNPQRPRPGLPPAHAISGIRGVDHCDGGRVAATLALQVLGNVAEAAQTQSSGRAHARRVDMWGFRMWVSRAGSPSAATTRIQLSLPRLEQEHHLVVSAGSPYRVLDIRSDFRGRIPKMRRPGQPSRQDDVLHAVQRAVESARELLELHALRVS